VTDVIPVLFWKIHARSATLDASAVHEHVNTSTHFVEGDIKDALDCLKIDKITRDILGPRDAIDDAASVASHEADTSTSLRKGECACLANAARCASDEDILASEREELRGFNVWCSVRGGHGESKSKRRRGGAVGPARDRRSR
jgi:hypothetical protein